MKISLIGMSGNGKSYWSKKLENMGFKRFCCDDLIEERLVKELKISGLSGTQDVAKWLGQPFDKQYQNSSKLYLQLETEIMNKVIVILEKSAYGENIVIDTTGSVIYIKENIMKRLAKLTKIIYLDTPSSVIEKMYKLYLADPKPVIWGKSFKKNEKETDMEALARCYSNLLAFRTKAYKKHAHIELDYDLLRKVDFNVDKFMEAI